MGLNKATAKAAKVARPRGRPKSDSRLDEVLTCAAAMFSTRGYSASGLEDIASQLGMTRAALYYYAESKEDLLEKCYAWTHARYRDRLDKELGEGTGRELLSRFFLLYGEAACDDSSRCFLSSEDHFLSPDRQKQAAERIHDVNRIATDLFKKGIEDGSLAECDHRYALATLFGAFNSLHRIQRSGGPSPRKMGEGLLAIVLNGILPRNELSSRE